jgi:hypothetical protein
MQRTAGKANRLKVWGNSLLNKLGSRTRKARKRHAAKIRRQEFKREDKRKIPD